MSEESKQEVQEIEVIETTNSKEETKSEEVLGSQETSESSESELKDEVKVAKEYGHLSKEEFVAKGGKPEDYKTEKEFNLTGELIELKRTLQKRDKDIESIVRFHEQSMEEQKKNLLKQVNDKLAEAKANMDVDAVESLTQQKQDLQRSQEIDRQQAAYLEIQEVDAAFREQNKSWLNSDHPELEERVRHIATMIDKTSPGLTYRQKAKEVQDRMDFELSRDERYAHLLKDTSKIERPTVSVAQSQIAISGALESASRTVIRMSADQKALYEANQRIRKNAGLPEITPKEYLEKHKRLNSLT